MDTINELQSLDNQIRKSGSSLYGLLSMLAGQFLGVPREPPAKMADANAPQPPNPA